MSGGAGLAAGADGSVEAFDPAGRLPVGRFAVEASAGTGKTYTLAGLTTRYFAEGHITPAELLIVTFTRAATGELRSRVRERLVSAAAHLRAHLAGQPSTGELPDPVLGPLLVDGVDGDPGDRLHRLEQAISEFDAATITTIHGFAAQVLGALGVGSGVATDVRFVDDTTDRLLEVCSDLMVGAAADPARRQHVSDKWDTFVMRVRHAISAPDLVILPAPGTPGVSPADQLLADLVREAVATLQGRRRESGTQSFDDLLVRLRDALGRGGHAEARTAAITTLRQRYRVALIDEFQDTDPVQWAIFRTLFAQAGFEEHAQAEAGILAPGSSGDGGAWRALVLVGDPKQAIYSFRGADVSTYIRAVRSDPRIQRRSLEVNWRSDGAMLRSLSRLFDGVRFGDGIGYSVVDPAPGHASRRLLHRDGTAAPALSIRCASGADLVPADRPDGEIPVGEARRAIYADLAAHAIELLEKAELPAERGRRRPVRPEDIAVLVRSNDQAHEVQAVLGDAGVPAVLARGSSVIDSPAARQLTWLLEALLRPSDQRRARTFALSWFGGRSVEWIAAAGDGDIAELQELLHEWNAVLTTRGVVEFVRRVWRDSEVVARLLEAPDGDRNVTDLEHLAELLHLGAGDGPVSPAGLLAVIRAPQLPDSARLDTDADTDIASRRVESDAAAVQVMTVWVAKGLEFPIVLCPTLWAKSRGDTDFHDPDTGDRCFDVTNGGPWPDKAAGRLRKDRADAERAEEALRLVYVALTRARHHTALWWVRATGSHNSALARLLFARTHEGAGPVDPALLASTSGDFKKLCPSHSGVVERLRLLAAQSDGEIEVCEHGRAPKQLPRWSRSTERPGAPRLRAAKLTRGADRPPLDRSRSRWSFTAVVSRDTSHGNPWDLSLSDDGADDEQRPPDAGLEDPAGPAEHAVGATSAASPLAWLPAGAAFGTLAHDVLERTDFTAEPLAGEIARVVAEQQAWRSLSLRPVGDARPWGDTGAEADGTRLLTDGLLEVVRTPLGPVFHGRPLADVPRADRLDELGFELHLGPAPGGRGVCDLHVGKVLLEHLAADDPFRPWAARLAAGLFGVDLAGHLTGSIDAVIRVGGDGLADRFVVVDYKSNRLHHHGTAPQPGDYGAASMRRSMVEHHYPLQALLYQVALHRYLRWRIPGYDPEVHLGGAAYLFLRGMAGEAVRTVEHQPDGVCSWRLPGIAISELSDLLDGRHPLLESVRPTSAPAGAQP